MNGYNDIYLSSQIAEAKRMIALYNSKIEYNKNIINLLEELLTMSDDLFSQYNINQLNSIKDIVLNCAQSISSSISRFSSIKWECNKNIEKIIEQCSSYINVLSESVDYYNREIEKCNELIDSYNNPKIWL